MAKKRAKSYHLAILALIMALGIASPSVVYLITVGNTALASEGDSTDVAGTSGTTGASGTQADNTQTGGATTDGTQSDETTETGTGEETTETPEGTDGLGDLQVGEARPTDAVSLQSALSNPDISLITVAMDITSDVNFTIDRSADKPLTLDLVDGAKIIATHEGARTLDFEQGTLEITGTGSIVASGADGIAIRVYGSTSTDDTSYTNLTVKKDVILEASTTSDASYGLFISHNNKLAYGVNVDFQGSISAANGITINGNIVDQEYYPSIKLTGARIQTAAEGTAIYAGGYAEWQITDSNITGNTGLGMKAGKFTIGGENNKITANGTKAAGSLNNNGIDTTGAVFQFEDNPGYARNVELTIDGGTYTAAHGDVFYEYGAATRGAEPSALKTLTVKSGKFIANEGKIIEGLGSESVKLQGGTYSPKVDGVYLTSDQEIVEVNGAWEIRPTVATKPDDGTTTNPGDNNNDDDQKPGTPVKPGVPGGTVIPDTGINNEIYSPRVVSAVKSAAAAIIAGILVVAALLLHRFTSRHHLEEEPKAAGRGNGRNKSGTAGKPNASAGKSASTSRATSSARASKASASAAKSAKASSRSTSAKTPAKSSKKSTTSRAKAKK